MVAGPSSHPGLLVVALLAGGLPAAAAPAAPAAVSDRYLLDDTDFVLAINVKQIFASPVLARHLQPQMGDVLKQAGVPASLRDIGTQVLRQADSILVVHGQSCHTDLAPAGLPLILIEGRFTPETVQAWGKQVVNHNLARLEAVTIEGVPGSRVTGLPEFVSLPGYWLSRPFGGESLFAALPAAHTLVLAPRKELVAQVIQKVAGKKKTSLGIPGMRTLLGQLDPQASVQLAAVREMVTGTEPTVTGAIPGTGNPMIGLKYVRLGDWGIESLCGSFTVGGNI